MSQNHNNIAEELASSTVSQSCGEVAQTLISASGIPFANAIGLLASSATSSVVEKVAENFNENTDGKKVDKGILQRAASTAEDWAEVVGANIKRFVNGEETSLGKDFEEFAKRHAIEDADIEKIKKFALEFGKDLAVGAAITVAAGAAVAAAPITIPAAAVGVAGVVANIAANKILDEAGNVVGEEIEKISGCSVSKLIDEKVNEISSAINSAKHSVEEAFHDLVGFSEDDGKHIASTTETSHIKQHPSRNSSSHSFAEDVVNHKHRNDDRGRS